jgi:hypothetical protein
MREKRVFTSGSSRAREESGSRGVDLAGLIPSGMCGLVLSGGCGDISELVDDAGDAVLKRAVAT